MAANLKMIAVLKQADNYLSIPVLVLSLLVLVLSWKVSSKSLSRVYCINIAVPSFICNLLFIGLKVANTMKPEITKPDNAFYKYYMGLVSFYAFCRSFTLNGYLYFSTLTVCLAYVGYVRPILFYALFNSRKITLMFVMCYVWTTFSIALQFSRFFLSGALNLIPEKFNFGPLMWLHVSVALICYGVMLIAYVLTVVELKKPSVGDVRTNAVNMSAQKRWRTLKSC